MSIDFRANASALIFAFLLAACEAPPQSTYPRPEIPPYRPSGVLTLVKRLPVKASQAQLSASLPVIMTEVARAGMSDSEKVREAVAILAHQPKVVEVLVTSYRNLPPQHFAQRLLTVQVIGQMRRADARTFLGEVVRKPLPADTPIKDGLSQRDIEEAIQVKAVHGLAFLRSDIAFDDIVKVMREHESEHVRREAIDAWLWNHGDRPKAAGELKALLPDRYHKFIGIPRFVRGMDAAAFNKHVLGKRRQDKGGRR